MPGFSHWRPPRCRTEGPKHKALQNRLEVRMLLKTMLRAEAPLLRRFALVWVGQWACEAQTLTTSGRPLCRTLLCRGSVWGTLPTLLSPETQVAGLTGLRCSPSHSKHSDKVALPHPLELLPAPESLTWCGIDTSRVSVNIAGYQQLSLVTSDHWRALKISCGRCSYGGIEKHELATKGMAECETLRAVPNCKLVLMVAYHLLSPTLSIEQAGLMAYLQTPPDAGPSVN